jgi:hypothetical protein
MSRATFQTAETRMITRHRGTEASRHFGDPAWVSRCLGVSCSGDPFVSTREPCQSVAMMTPRMNECPAPHSFEHSNV